MSKPSPVDAHEAAVVARATRWTACLVLGRGDRRTVECGSLAAAHAAAAELDRVCPPRRAMIYAISPTGAFVLVTPENSG